ncbi:hypothetical protein ACLKMH_02860 [Psychromonas sp. KJ10-10]
MKSTTTIAFSTLLLTSPTLAIASQYNWQGDYIDESMKKEWFI